MTVVSTEGAVREERGVSGLSSADLAVVGGDDDDHDDADRGTA